MTPQQIIECLKNDGIELRIDKFNLRVQSTKSKITDAQKSLIAANKTVLLAFLRGDERISGVICTSDEKHRLDMPLAAKELQKNLCVFKEYKQPNGEILRLTKDEFDRVIDLFRFLHYQSQKISLTK